MSDANSVLILLVIIVNLILYPKIISEYIFELIIWYERKNINMLEIEFSLHFEVVALENRGLNR